MENFGFTGRINAPHVMTAEAAKAAAAAAGVDTGSDDSNSFGDLLAELLRTLPREASALFLRSLSGLSPSESHDFCDHVSKLKPEKQYRVIHAMSEATVDGKRRFLFALAKKIEEQQAKQQVIQEQVDKDIVAHVKIKEAIHAKQRVKAINAAAKYHSFNDALGAGVSVKENTSNGGNGASPSANGCDPSSSSSGSDTTAVGRSLSSSSIQITKEDIKQVGRLLSNSHITESEQNLRELEINKKAFAALKSSGSSGGDSTSESVEMGDAAKRDRPDSIRELVKHDEKPLQRTRSDDPDQYTYQYDRQYSHETGTSTGTENDNDNGNDQDGNDSSGDGDGDNDSQEAEDPEAPSTKRWTKLQDNALRESVRIHGEKNWKAIAELVPGRNHAQCLQRWRKVLKPGLVKGHWSFEEDQILEYLVTQGCNNWGQIAERIPGRTPKQCRERWKNHLDPAINKGPYTEEEDKVILDAQAKLGNKWSQIAQLLKGRTEDSVKIRWKSLKQNPAKAAASHLQQKKAQQQQQQHHHQQHHHQHQAAPTTAALAYQQNPALLRQRQLQLMQQQQQLQHSEASVQIEHQQQLQQQQMQLRLQERLMHQQQLQRSQGLHSSNSTNHGRIDLSAMKPDPSLSLPSPVTNLGLSMAGSHLYSPAAYHNTSFTAQLTGVDHSSPYDFNIQTTSSSTSSGSAYGGYSHQHSHNDGGPDLTHFAPRGAEDPRDSGGDAWDLGGGGGSGNGDDGFARLGENPPPASFWDNYPKHHGGLLPEPIPLSAQGGHHESHGHFGVPEDDVVYDDAMFEKLATELGSNSLHFAPL